MPENTKASQLKAAKEKRILNEFDAKNDNVQKMDTVVGVREGGDKSLHNIIPFDCECDDKSCKNQILMSTEEYKQAHRKPNNFVVFPSHVHSDIEEVIASFSNYVIVAKIIRPA